MNTPEKTTAAAFSRYMSGRVVADSAVLHWPGLYARRFQFPRIVDRFLVPATAEPHISCGIAGTAQFQEREREGTWIVRHIRPGDLFVTRSRTPYEVRFTSPPGQELQTVQVHVAVPPYRAALEAVYPVVPMPSRSSISSGATRCSPICASPVQRCSRGQSLAAPGV